MFDIFGKKKKVKEPYVHPQFDEMKYGGVSWSPSFMFKVEIWDKTFDVEISFMADSEDEHINREQEEAFEKFKNIIVEQRDDIEQLIVSTYTYVDSETDVRDRVYPISVDFSRTGECALYFLDEEEGDFDTDAGFAIFLIPQLIFNSAEETIDFMNGHIDLDHILWNVDPDKHPIGQKEEQNEV